MVNESTFTGRLIEARVVGLFRMKDHGMNDFKVLGDPNSDPLFAEFQELHDVPAHFLREVEHFFATCKQLEGVATESQGWAGTDEAIAEVQNCIERYRARPADGEDE